MTDEIKDFAEKFTCENCGDCRCVLFVSKYMPYPDACPIKIECVPEWKRERYGGEGQ